MLISHISSCKAAHSPYYAIVNSLLLQQFAYSSFDFSCSACTWDRHFTQRFPSKILPTVINRAGSLDFERSHQLLIRKNPSIIQPPTGNRIHGGQLHRRPRNWRCYSAGSGETKSMRVICAMWSNFNHIESITLQSTPTI